MPSRACNILRRLAVGKDIEGITLLVGHVIVVVVVVEGPNLGLDIVLLELGAEMVTDEITLLLKVLSVSLETLTRLEKSL